jgi:hypothetical protein
MRASSFASVLAFCAFGCGAVVQPGLANAPALGGATSETRVHDATANGHDACERAMFPQGEVLRGQVPPCNKESRVQVAASASPPSAVESPNVTYSLRYCAAGRRSLESDVRKGGPAFAFPLSASPWWVACDDRWGVDGVSTPPAAAE